MNVLIRQRQIAVLRRRVGVEDLPPVHDVGVHIHRVDRVLRQDHAVAAEDIEDPGDVVFGAVGDENLVRFQPHAARGIIVPDGFAQKIIPLVGAVAKKALRRAEFQRGLGQGLGHGRAQGPRHVADAHADDPGLGVGAAVGVGLLADFGKKVVFHKPGVIRIDHSVSPQG